MSPARHSAATSDDRVTTTARGIDSDPLDLDDDATTLAVEADRSEAYPSPTFSARRRTPGMGDGDPAAGATSAADLDALNATDEELREQERIAATASPVVVRPRHTTPSYRLTPLQQWEGKVVDVTRDEFTAIVHDLTSPTNPPEEVVLTRGDVSDGDLPLLAPGAIFYWTIGRKRLSHGQIERTSVIKFRRSPVWSQGAVDAVKREAERLKDLFGVHD